MQVAVLNGTLSEMEQTVYIRRVTAKYPIWAIEKLILAAFSIASATCGKWADIALANPPTGIPPSRRNSAIHFQTELMDSANW